jgi:hypothetical protein
LLELCGREEEEMPRKQRFKPSRKPKAVGTLTEFAPLRQAEPPLEAARSQEIVPGGVDADARGHRTTDLIPSMIDLGGESG